MATYATIDALRADIADLKAGDASRSDTMRAILRAELYPAVDAVGYVEIVSGRYLETFAEWRLGSLAPGRPVPSTAKGAVTLSNASATSHAIGAGFAFVHSTTSKRYRALRGGTLPGRSSSLAPPGTLRVLVEAEEPGEASTAAPGTVTALATPIADVTVTNASPIVGAGTVSDAEYRAHILSPGSQAARAVRREDGSPLGVTRTASISGVLYAATAGGGDLSSPDLAVLSQKLRVTADNAVDEAIAIAYSLEVLDVADVPSTPALEATILARLDEHFASLPISATVRVDAIDTAIRAALGMGVRNGYAPPEAATMPLAIPGGSTNLVSLEVTSPAADVPLVAGRVPVLGTVTPTVTRSP